MNLPPSNVCRRIRQLFRLVGSTNPNEGESARTKLFKLLAAHSLTWNDLPEVIAAANAADAAKAAYTTTSQPASSTKPQVNVLDLLMVLIEEYVAITPEQRMAVSLWILHTHVCEQFAITPRLALLSPVSECGKTTVLILADLWSANGDRSDNTTAAAIYHALTQRLPTLLIDEGDNLSLPTNNVLRAVFNAGHRRGGAIKRFVGGRSRKFQVFAPLAIAAIGTLPQPLMKRSVVINMQRRPPGEPPLKKLDELNPDPALLAARSEIQKWAATCSLNRDPDMPSELHNRISDNWRILLAIADDLGHSDEARAAALALSSERRLVEDPGVVLLQDVRYIFDARGVDRMFSAVLVDALNTLEDSLWSEWRGLRGDQQPRRLSPAELARLLAPFRIRPRSIWPVRRASDVSSKKGYLRSQFEAGWRSYCGDGTPAQPRPIRYFAVFDPARANRRS
jgi:hypothetical protein